jgi:deoxycytidylate deaminase
VTCAKKRVFCELYDEKGDLVSVGSNSCAKPQKACPRKHGEGYEKCWSVCEQYGHAEEVALDIAHAQPMYSVEGGKAVIYGHTRACDGCRQMLKAAGITEVEFR